MVICPYYLVMDANSNAVEFEIVDNMNLIFRIHTEMFVMLLMNIFACTNGGSYTVWKAW